MEIKIQNVSMTYPSGKQALKGLVLRHDDNKIIGILTHNNHGFIIQI